MTNTELGDMLGLSESMASRLRNGRRLPSVSVLNRIHTKFIVDYAQLMKAYEDGPRAFGELFCTLHTRG